MIAFFLTIAVLGVVWLIFNVRLNQRKICPAIGRKNPYLCNKKWRQENIHAFRMKDDEE